jgi:hypothetical protein
MELRSLANGDEDLESFFSDDSTPAPQSATTDVGPDINQFENFGDYLTAVVDHAKAGGADKKNILAGVDVPNVGSGSNSNESDDLDDLDDLDVLLDSLGSFESPSSKTTEAPPSRASSGEVDYGNYKMPELKALLKSKGLKVGGTKAELIQRLENN